MIIVGLVNIEPQTAFLVKKFADHVVEAVGDRSSQVSLCGRDDGHWNSLLEIPHDTGDSSFGHNRFLLPYGLVDFRRSSDRHYTDTFVAKGF
jgi:hypothetical protein